MKNKMAFALTVMAFALSTTALGAPRQDILIEGQTKTVIQNPSYNINPWNTISITGVGNDNLIQLYTPYKTIKIPLNAPLYKITDYYCDKIIKVDGVWGVERNVAVETFNGNEDWQLYKKQSYQNDKTVIFSWKNTNNVGIRNGYCSHFDVHTYSSQQTNIYDGISFKNGEILMRFMNVRNVKNVESIKNYLKTQYDNGNPVTLYYVNATPHFEPFSTDIQDDLNAAVSGNIGYTDFNVSGIKMGDMPDINTNIFSSPTTGNSVMMRLLSATEDVKILNSNGNTGFFISDILPTAEGLTIKITDKNQNTYEAEVLFAKADFMTAKPTEILFEGKNQTVIRLILHLSQIQLPNAPLGGFSYDETGILDSCIVPEELILPSVIPVSEGTWVDFNNALLHQNPLFKSQITIKDSNGTIIFTNGKMMAAEGDFSVFLNGKFTTTTEIVFTRTNEKTATLLFMGDSLLNQNYYTDYFVHLFPPEQIQLIGTRGNEGSAHEGRGGWSAYDYCNISSKFGFSNPFLNNGKFDFSYYMQNNGYKNVDYIVINLGINDINLMDHNSPKEISGYFDKIVESIHAYDPHTKIIINTPIMPFATEETAYAKDQRVEFIKFLNAHYSDTDIYICPTYLSLNNYDDFKFKLPLVNEDSQDMAMVVTDTTHPNLEGYRNLAESSYSAIDFLNH